MNDKKVRKVEKDLGYIESMFKDYLDSKTKIDKNGFPENGCDSAEVMYCITECIKSNINTARELFGTCDYKIFNELCSGVSKEVCDIIDILKKFRDKELLNILFNHVSTFSNKESKDNLIFLKTYFNNKRTKLWKGIKK